jgi:sodium-dependent dicarboxylate transporter 2/3/5
VGWGTFLVVAAGIAIGGAAYQSGLARYLAHLLFAQMLIVLPPFGRRIALSWATSLLHALFASNTVTGSIVAPLLIPLAQELGLDVWRTMAPSAYTISLAFLLISESPCSLIAYQTGYFSARDFTRAGFLFTLVIGPVLAVVLSVM